MKWIIEKWPQTIFRPIQLKEESSSNFSQHAKSWSWGESCVMAEACCNLPGSMEKVRNPSFLSTHFLSSQTNAKTGEPLDFFFFLVSTHQSIHVSSPYGFFPSGPPRITVGKGYLWWVTLMTLALWFLSYYGYGHSREMIEWNLFIFVFASFFSPISLCLQPFWLVYCIYIHPWPSFWKKICFHSVTGSFFDQIFHPSCTHPSG